MGYLRTKSDQVCQKTLNILTENSECVMRAAGIRKYRSEILRLETCGNILLK